MSNQPTKSIAIDHQATTLQAKMKTIKLFAPFRSGSNLVKACIEHNYADLRVFNTGKSKHWKHGFFVDAKNHDGYIFCARHPLDLACSIRRYYFKNGRNITIHAEWDTFFDRPIAIFDQTKKTTTSPLYFPNIYHLINAWYYNYTTILARKKYNSALILYENLISCQEITIKKLLTKINIDPENLSSDFQLIQEKTKNLGDERYVKPKNQKTNFSSEISTLRTSCGFASEKLKSELSIGQLTSAKETIDWNVMKQIGYDEKGIL